MEPPDTSWSQSWSSQRAMLAVGALSCLLLLPQGAPAWITGLWVGGALLLALCTVADPLGSRWTQIVASVVLVGVAGGVVGRHLDAPARALALGVVVCSALGHLWTPRALAPFAPEADPQVNALRAGAWSATASLLLTQLLGEAAPPHALGAALGIAWFPVILALRIPRIPLLAIYLAVAVPLLVAVSALQSPSIWQPWLLTMGPAALGWSASLSAHDRRSAGPLDLLTARPAVLLAASFAGLCAIGTALLTLPGISAGPSPPPLLDLAFTAISASCVTGLSVLVLPQDFSFVGQLVILGLIQVGGIGIMTFSTLIFSALGRRMSMPHEASAGELLGSRDLPGIRRSLRRIGLITLTAEGVGAVLLVALFLARGESWGSALWRGIFTAISAFCNAGLTLQPDSLAAYRDDPLVLGVIGTLLFLGGLGPLVVAALPRMARGARVTLHARLAVYTSLGLILIPALLFTATEWTQSLDGLPAGHRVSNALFQVLSLRTAGLTTLPLEALAPSTWTLCLVLMFIGGSPGSTAGGLKTTTLAVLLLAIRAAMQGRPEIRAFGAFIPHRTVQEAASLATVGVAAVLGALVGLQLTQPVELSLALFEVVSALSTAGASTGATAEVDSVGKLLLMGCMFAGRVGPMTLLALLASVQPEALLRYPRAKVPVG